MTSARGDGVGLGMLGDLLVFAGGAKGNANLSTIDVYNTTDNTWRHAHMSVTRVLFDGAALGHIAIFGCGEGDGGDTADVLDARTMKVTTVKLAGGSRKKCAAVSVTLAKDATSGMPTAGKIIIGGGYKSTAVDVYDYATGKWSLAPPMSISHFYMAAASAGPYSLFCGGLAPSGDTDICDIYDAIQNTWSIGHLAKPVREIGASSTSTAAGGDLAIFLGGGQTSVFNATEFALDSTSTAVWTYANSSTQNPTSPWGKMGRAMVGENGEPGRYALFGGGNGNNPNIQVFDGATGAFTFARKNLSFGREQVMGAGGFNKVAFAGGSIGAYKPTGFTARVDIFDITELLRIGG